MDTKPLKAIARKLIATSTPGNSSSDFISKLNYSDTFSKLRDFSESVETPHISPIRQMNKTKVVRKRPAAIDMICAAIQEIGLPRKGASYKAIKKSIFYRNPDMDQTKSLVYIKKALLKGLESGVLARASKSKNVIGANGCFIISSKSNKKLGKKESSSKPKANGGRKQKLDIPMSGSEVTAGNAEKGKAKQVINPDVLKQVRNVKGTGKPTINVKTEIETPKMTIRKKPTPRVLVRNGTQPEAAALKQNRKGGEIKTTALTTQAKPSGSNATRKEPNIKKLYSSKMFPVFGRARKDLSDSEMEVSRVSRKRLKTYSSDTELEISKSVVSSKSVYIVPGIKQGIADHQKAHVGVAKKKTNRS